MTRWVWLKRKMGYCFLCKTLKTGVWRHYDSPTTSSRDVCGECAGGEGA